MTPQEIITEVRRIIQDTRTPYRYDDAVLLGFVNQTIKRMAVIRPDLFATIANFTTTPDSVVQSCPADSLRLIEIFHVLGGGAITEVSRDVMDQSYPNWTSEASGTPVNFMRHVRNQNRFFVYPRPVGGVVLVGEYAQTPPTYTIAMPITTPTDTYFPVIVDGTVYMAESIDDEHVNANRAKQYLESFTQSLGLNLQSRETTDSESGGLNPERVV